MPAGEFSAWLLSAVVKGAGAAASAETAGVGALATGRLPSLLPTPPPPPPPLPPTPAPSPPASIGFRTLASESRRVARTASVADRHLLALLNLRRRVSCAQTWHCGPISRQLQLPVRAERKRTCVAHPSMQAVAATRALGGAPVAMGAEAPALQRGGPPETPTTPAGSVVVDSCGRKRMAPCARACAPRTHLEQVLHKVDRDRRHGLPRHIRVRGLSRNDLCEHRSLRLQATITQ